MDKETFTYTYSAKQQEEIQNIRKKYLPTEDKMEQLRRLDRSAAKRDTCICNRGSNFASCSWGRSCAVRWSGRGHGLFLVLS